MKRLVPTLLAVLFLAGCAVNKPLPVEPVKLAGMEFYPSYDKLAYGFECNTFNGKAGFNWICLQKDNFIVWKLYDGDFSSSYQRNQFVVNHKDKIEKDATAMNFEKIHTSNNDLLIFKNNDSSIFMVSETISEPGYVATVYFVGKSYKDKLPIIDQILADLKNYSPRLGSEQ